MDVEFDSIFSAIGCSTFWDFSHDLGSETLTLEFLSTLQAFDDGVYFRMFNYDYNFTWTNLSATLVFAHSCNIDDITKLNECFRPRANDIHNPTLRFMHRWIGITLFPRDDVRVVKNDDMRVLYAMVHKIHVSPVKAMVEHWLSVSERKGPIEFTSLISRIADLMGVLILCNILPHLGA
jgi:hypothetical protein